MSIEGGDIAQLVERLVRNQQARGSNPLISRGNDHQRAYGKFDISRRSVFRLIQTLEEMGFPLLDEQLRIRLEKLNQVEPLPLECDDILAQEETVFILFLYLTLMPFY